MKTIYIVMGSTGEYSDREEWPIRATKQEDRAKFLVSTLDDLAHENRVSMSTLYLAEGEDKEAAIQVLNNAVERAVQVGYISYTGISFHYISVPMEA